MKAGPWINSSILRFATQAGVPAAVGIQNDVLPLSPPQVLSLFKRIAISHPNLRLDDLEVRLNPEASPYG